MRVSNTEVAAVKTRFAGSGIRRTYKMFDNGMLISEEQSCVRRPLPSTGHRITAAISAKRLTIAKNRLLARKLASTTKIANRRIPESAICDELESVKCTTVKKAAYLKNNNRVSYCVSKARKRMQIASNKSDARGSRLPSARRVAVPVKYFDSETIHSFLSSEESTENSVGDLQKMGLFEQPLIVEGKRPWKPSLKVQMKLSDMSYDQKRILKNVDNGSGSNTLSSESSSKEVIRKDISKYTDQIVNKTPAMLDAVKAGPAVPVATAAASASKTSGLIKPAKLTFKSSLEKKSEEEEKKKAKRLAHNKVQAKVRLFFLNILYLPLAPGKGSGNLIAALQSATHKTQT